MAVEALKRTRRDALRGRSMTRAQQCEGKQRFDSPHIGYRINRRKKAPKRDVYRCPHCGGWHLGG